MKPAPVMNTPYWSLNCFVFLVFTTVFQLILIGKKSPCTPFRTMLEVVFLGLSHWSPGNLLCLPWEGFTPFTGILLWCEKYKNFFCSCYAHSQTKCLLDWKTETCKFVIILVNQKSKIINYQKIAKVTRDFETSLSLLYVKHLNIFTFTCCSIKQDWLVISFIYIFQIVDIAVDHPSCSKQHAVLQYRLVDYEKPDGTSGKRVKYVLHCCRGFWVFLETDLTMQMKKLHASDWHTSAKL